ncbi:MAG: MBL fold metallo-hydrolase [Patescibacteria group bacterium]|jgi:ribonuclease BN (tRNA processing enzyme)
METRGMLPGEKYSLQNDGQLELFFLGVGSADAERNFQTNFLIIKGKTHILVDFGQKAQIALRQTANLAPTDIEVLLPTHSHADHIGGIETLALANRYKGRRMLGKDKLKMIVSPEYQRVLWECSLRGGLEYNEQEADGRRLSLVDYFSIVQPRWKVQQPREIFSCNYAGIDLEIFRTMHTPDNSTGWGDSFLSYGLFIDGHVFVSCDTRFDRQLIDFYADRSSVMFHDVQFFPGAVHAPLADLQTLPAEIRGKMHLIHYADNWENQDITGFAGWTQQGVRYIF